MRIYVSHCSAKKSESAKLSGRKVTPDRLYTSRRIQGFMRACKRSAVKWAIFSDLYGVWFPHTKHAWYEKAPDDVNEQEFKRLVRGFDRDLKAYDEIWFYHHPARFHWLYRRLLNESKQRHRIRLFTRVAQIEQQYMMG